MAHFAKLDDNSIVIEIHRVANEALDAENEETSGIEFLTHWSGGYPHWKQCSINASIRKKYPIPGDIYDATLDAFISPQCHVDATLNVDTAQWECTSKEHDPFHA